jgi:putative ABC transport system substrate-binding protein
MRRIGLAVVLALSLVVAPLVASAQPGAKVYRIGYLAFAPRPADDAFRQGLKDLGYVEGQNITITHRYAEGSGDTLHVLAQQLVTLKVDVLVTVGSPATRAAQEATKSIPIVMTNVGDPVAYGFVPSLARPTGNITGMAAGLLETASKGLQFIKELVPTSTRLAILGNRHNPGAASTLKSMSETAHNLGLTTLVYDAESPESLKTALAAIIRGRADILSVIPDPALQQQRARIIEFAATHRLPTMYMDRESVLDGGLMAYDPSREEMFRRTARHVDKILKGAKPAELPVEQPTKFELLVNLKTAKALGLTIPQTLLLRADEVIK